MADDFPLFNGQKASWADVAVRTQMLSTGLEVKTGDFTKLDWEAAVDAALVRGEGGGVAGDTKGSYTPKATIAMLASGFDKLATGLRLSNPLRRGLTNMYFNILAAWDPVGDLGVAFFERQKLEILTARIISMKSANAAGSSDAKVIECELMCRDIRINGKSLYY